MMQEERRKRILECLGREQTVQVKDLAALFSVSFETVRRDLEELEREGCLTRVYGGAVRRGFYKTEPDYRVREAVNIESKRAIARLAADMVEDGDTLFLDVGTTVREVARLLADKRALTAVTHSLPIASILCQNTGTRVVLLGGELRSGEYATSGSGTIEQLSRFRAAKHIMGVGGLTPREGVTDYHIEEAAVRRVMTECARRTIALADSTKFGVVAPNVICGAGRLAALVTDSASPPEMLRQIESMGVEVVVADTETENREKHQ